MRIAVAGFQHETNSFVVGTASLADFQSPGGWPKFTRGESLVADMASTAAPMAGALAAALQEQVEIVPLLWCMALPSGPVEDAAFEAIAGEIVERLRQALRAAPIDGIYLDLHGAMITESIDDAEGELLRRLRAVTPAPLPLVCSLDLHANVSAAMVERATLLDTYKTYPHVDMKETGARAMRRLIAIARDGRAPHKAFRPLPFLTPIDAQCTLAEPARMLVARGDELERRGEAQCVSQFFGFPLADIADAGPSLVVYVREAEGCTNTADALADTLTDTWLRSEGAFGRRLPDAAEAVALALAEQAGAGPVIIADTQDNPGGGGTGDTTGLLAALLDAGAAGAVVVHIADEPAARAAHAAGIGGSIDMPLGGRADARYGPPVAGPFRVLALGDGDFIGVGPMYGGNRITLGPVALLEKNGVRVIVAPRKMQASEPALLHHLGLRPQDIAILAVKSSVHFRGAYQAMARRIIVATAPGAVCADLALLPYRKARRRVAGAHATPARESR